MDDRSGSSEVGEFHTFFENVLDSARFLPDAALFTLYSVFFFQTEKMRTERQGAEKCQRGGAIRVLFRNCNSSLPTSTSPTFPRLVSSEAAEWGPLSPPPTTSGRSSIFFPRCPSNSGSTKGQWKNRESLHRWQLFVCFFFQSSVLNNVCYWWTSPQKKKKRITEWQLVSDTVSHIIDVFCQEPTSFGGKESRATLDR